MGTLLLFHFVRPSFLQPAKPSQANKRPGRAKTILVYKNIESNLKIFKCAGKKVGVKKQVKIRRMVQSDAANAKNGKKPKECTPNDKTTQQTASEVLQLVVHVPCAVAPDIILWSLLLS